MDKTIASPKEAVAGIGDGATVMIGGFGGSGAPIELIHALIDAGPKNLTVINNNTGNGHVGLAALIEQGQVARMICSFPRSADPKVFTELYLAGQIELELVPQGTLAERMRAVSTPLLGAPYAADPEGEGFGHDPDPPARYDAAVAAGNVVVFKAGQDDPAVLLQIEAGTLAQGTGHDRIDVGLGHRGGYRAVVGLPQARGIVRQRDRRLADLHVDRGHVGHLHPGHAQGDEQRQDQREFHGRNRHAIAQQAREDAMEVGGHQSHVPAVDR